MFSVHQLSSVQAQDPMYDSKYTTDYLTALNDLNAARETIKELGSTIEANNEKHERIIEENKKSHLETVY